MKKISILALCAVTAMGAMAQEQVLKNAEKAMKSNKGFDEVIEIITPAFSDPSTAKAADTYYIPGKAAFNQYDKALGLAQLGQLKEPEQATMYKALINGFDYMLKALPLDTVVDEKGKTKTKRSKDIIQSVAGHHNDLVRAGVFMFEQKDYPLAYEAFEYYVKAPENEKINKALLVPAPDSVRSDIAFNMGLAAYNMGDNQKTLDAFMLAKKLGYKEKALYDYSISIASALGDKKVIEQIAREAMELYGDQDPNYIGYIINGYIDDGKYNEALSMIDQAIAGDPNNAQYYVIKGILLDQDGVDGDPKEAFNKAVEIDPYNAMALYHAGRMIYNEALELYNNAPSDDQAFGKFFVTEFKPLMLKAVDLFESSYNVDNNYKEPLKLLYQAYYMLNDEKNMQDTENRLNE